MKRPLSTLLLCTLALLVATSAHAQEHQHQPADTTRAMPMDHGQMEGMDHSSMDMEGMMPQMMAMHERMMADSSMHRRMMANPDMQAMMQEMMGGEMDMAAMRERMAAMSPDERQAHMQQMHARMMERMAAMDPERRRAMHERMMTMHQGMMNDPEMRERMMADPEMRQMMDRMHGEEMMQDGMDHGQMDHGSMDGMDPSGSDGAMQGMDHGQMDHSQMAGMDHTDGVAQQRRNAGAQTGDEREQSSTVGAAAFDASATADRFHAALATGNRAAMEALLAPDAVVLEGGAHESRAEYLSHHFARDVEFLSGAATESLYRRTGVAGDAAWVASTQRVGDVEMAELLVMKRTPDGWRVAAVHWSSAR